MQLPQIPLPLLDFLRRYRLHIALVVITLTACWFVWSPKSAPPETPAPEIQQADGSKILERKPDADAKAPMQLPKGAKVERLVKLTVQAKNPLSESVNSVLPENLKQEQAGNNASFKPLDRQSVDQDCPPVTVDLALVKMPDDTRRVVASSPDGEILGGIDVPVTTAELAPAPKLWAVGAVTDPFKRTMGGFVDRDFGWLRTGIQINQRNEGELPTQGWIKLGIRF